ncbi:Uncharacterised protein [Acinetobacter baumannii]|nr:hypothetical protein CPT_Maestro_061 [Acinetobacter phage Maestro]QQM18551.1 hypothetical protein CPT_Morttis_058 [Acinetobacter phage Morttis]QQO96761.1 hypothetical protein CPT_Melin_060 [Acinetobacter phage Melin]SSU39390.1 Uncharacterised protein [Acinetobacter baumannii]
MSNKVNELAFKIIEWESFAQECFMDYYLHDCVDWEDWKDWLIKQGHIERANAIGHQIYNEKNRCIDQELLFRVFGNEPIVYEDATMPVVEYREDPELYMELWRKDVFLWAQYLASNDEDYEHVTNWINKYYENT